MRETAKAIARTDTGSNELTAGEILRSPVSGDRQISASTVELPEGDEPKSLTLESDDSSEQSRNEPGNPAGSQKNLIWNDTHKAGLYRLNWQETPGSSGTNLYAVNPDARESDLTRISVDELRQRWRGIEPEIITALTSAGTNVGVRGQEVWRSMAFCLLGLMGLESCFATWVGRQR